MNGTYDPTNPDQHAHQEPLDAVVSAWTGVWPDRQWQVDCYGYLHEIFPALTAALNRLAAWHANATPVSFAMDFASTPAEQPTPAPDDDVAAETLHEVQDQFEGDDLVAMSEPRFVPEDHTIEEVGERARVATDRLKRWGRKRQFRDLVARETKLRIELVVWLNNRSNMTQRIIADMMGVSLARITQIIGDYYNRLDYEQNLNSRRRGQPARIPREPSGSGPELSGSLRVTHQVEKLLRVFLADPDKPQYGYDLVRETKISSGGLYPMLARLQRVGWLMGQFETVEDMKSTKRPARKWYRFTPEGLAAARHELGMIEELNNAVEAAENTIDSETE